MEGEGKKGEGREWEGNERRLKKGLGREIKERCRKGKEGKKEGRGRVHKAGRILSRVKKGCERGRKGAYR